MTDNHNYETPAKGQTNWHVPLNSNFESLDTDVEVRDLEENRGSYTPKQGAKFLATDTESAFVGDGENWVRLRSRGQSASFESVVRQNRGASGYLFKNPDGNYRAISAPTEERWTDPSDAGAVANALLDALREAQGRDKNLGKVVIADGSYEFNRPVVQSDHRGVKWEGNSFRQSNNQGPTQIRPGSGFPDGRGIFELGNIGNASKPGDGEATQFKGLYFDMNGRDCVGIYNYRQDRVRCTDVKGDDVGPNGASIAYLGSFNSTWRDCYFEQAVIVEETDSNKDTNSFRCLNTTFNTSNPSVAPIVYRGKGARWVSTIVEAVSTGSTLNDGVALLSENTADTGIYNVDSRIDQSTLLADNNRTQFTACLFIGEQSNNDLLMENIKDFQFSACKFAGGRIENFSATSWANCWFVAAPEYFIRHNGNHGRKRSQLVGCGFQEYATSGDFPAILVEPGVNLEQFVVVGNSFRPQNSNPSADLSFGNNVESYVVANNYVGNGIKTAFEGSLVGSPGTVVPLVVNNQGHNPVGRSRSTPPIPTAGSFVDNLEAQGVWVYHDGSEVTTEEFGTTHSWPTDPSPVFVPRHGRIKWEEPPNDMTWQWQ